MKYRPIRLAIRLRVLTRIIRVMTRSIKANVPNGLFYYSIETKECASLMDFIDKS